MRFVLNTRDLSSPASLVCITGLARQLKSLGHIAVINDWCNYRSYDVAIFMAADAHCSDVRRDNPKIIIGIADPKPSTELQAREADFCIVSSIEQREMFMVLNRNQFIYYMVPDFDANKVQHCPKDIYRIVYHGNKVHLNGSYQSLVPALNELGKKYPIQLDAIYNIQGLGVWSMGRPDSRYCRTRDLQWYPNCYKDYFDGADIGIVQNLIPWRWEKLTRLLGTVSTTLLLESKFDHAVKYKSSANAGRALVFGYFGIPVVADAVPSISDVIIDGHSGRLVLTADGWYDALEELIISSERRQFLGDNFYRDIHERFAPEVSTRRLVDFISQLRHKPRIILRKRSPSVIGELYRYWMRKFIRKLNTMYGK